MKNLNSKIAIILFLTILLVTSCMRVPISGRKQLSLLPESNMVSMALTSYEEFLNEHPLSKDLRKTNIVKDVGSDIANAVNLFMKEKNMEDRIAGYEWEFNLVEENTPNAWCMPGGKVVVYSGLLPIASNDQLLAVVIGHEIAHAVARHGNERMSQGMLLQLGGIALDVALNEKPDETRLLFQQAYGITSQLAVALPYSRMHETEADQLGLIFIAMAGYNPEVAVEFWQRMSSAGGNKPPEFLSTHPNDETRINNIKGFLPEAMKYYKK
ncbi:MAG: M48 family metallopeptidase [Bacteroidales bacterium]|jgi:predicted Zn-dependent protease|nr:M48 family metallopeptidase [Bacteroidales bacterium]